MRDLNDMVIFAEVVHSGSFTAAANKLGLPKSNISRRISRLEKHLGVCLLQRTTRRLRQTEIGEVYYQHCQNILKEAEYAERSISQLDGVPRGLLKVSTSVTIGQRLLAPIMAEYLDQNPKVQLQLSLANHLVDLIEEDFDVAIRAGKLSDSRLVARRLGTAKISLYASKKYLAREGMPQHPDELAERDFLVMRENSNVGQLVLQCQPNARKNRTAGEEEKFIIKTRVFINDFSSIHRLVVDGIGIAALPDYIGLSEQSGEQLIKVLPEWSAPSVELHAIYPSLRGVTPKLDTFIDFIINRFSTQKILSL